MSKVKTLRFEGPDWMIEAEEIDERLLADLLDCGAPGPADEAVAYVIREHDVSGHPEDIAAMLRGYGAWDEEDLKDYDENLARVVWLVGCDLRETGEAHLSTY